MHTPPISHTTSLQVAADLVRTMVETSIKVINDEKIATLAQSYQEKLEGTNSTMGFNVFRVISQIYHRENLHSDVMAFLLDPEEEHQKGRLFFDLFLDLLVSAGASVSRADFPHPRIEREKGRIDILISDSETDSTIIVENKISAAKDQERQIPRYLNWVESSGRCKAIVYIPKLTGSRPSMDGWTSAEKSRISELLVCIPGYAGLPPTSPARTQLDLYSGWLLKALNTFPEQDDCFFFVKHYATIIQKIGFQNMNKPLMEDFYREMKDQSRFQSALALKALMEDFPLYRAQRFVEHFATDLHPFTSGQIYRDYDAYFIGVNRGDSHFGVDVEMKSDCSIFNFWDRNDGADLRGQAKELLTKMGVLGDYTRTQWSYCKVFRFPKEEEELYQHMRDFKAGLGRLLGAA